MSEKTGIDEWLTILQEFQRVLVRACQGEDLEEVYFSGMLLLSRASNEGWQLAHNKRECGHPRSCYQDKNWPQSERNYNPETRTSDPPMLYSCLMCEQAKEIERLKKTIRECIAWAGNSWDSETNAGRILKKALEESS